MVAGLATAVLNLSFEKDEKLRTSNWELFPLSPAQRQYAALDALASFLLYEVAQSARAGNCVLHYSMLCAIVVTMLGRQASTCTRPPEFHIHVPY
jgi:hypothetical protein